MAGYQSFPGKPGDSDSMRKLASLALPPMAGKSFLDLGCNEGYFCGYAFFDGASRVVGIDNNENFLNAARGRFPQCDFRNGNWEQLDDVLEPGEQFDVILCASALHYAVDQPAAVARFMDRLKPRGVLVLEIGVIQNSVPTATNGWHSVKRSIDERLFADWTGIAAMLGQYAYKHMGGSVAQAGDPIGREVFHVRRKLPFAVLIMGEPATGKSTLARDLFRHLPVISGDVIIDSNSEILAQLLQESYSPQNISRMLERLLVAGAMAEYVQLVVAQAKGGSFVYDGYIPSAYRKAFMKELEKLNYMPVDISLPEPEYAMNALSRRGRQEARKYQLFLSAMQNCRRRP